MSDAPLPTTPDEREPWQLSREEYLEYLKTLDPQDWFYETEDWGEVVCCEFDALAKRLLLECDLGKHDPSHRHLLLFEGVRAVYFESGRDGTLVGPRQDIPWDTSVFRTTGVGIVTMTAEGMKIYDVSTRNEAYSEALRKLPPTVPNFILSFGIFRETLCIEASRLTIDGRVFEVGYPTPWRET